jgi:hypothetical protein
MKQISVIISVAVVLAGCQIPQSLMVGPSGAVSRTSSHPYRLVDRTDSDCGSYPVYVSKRGGKMAVPVVQSSGNFAGYFGYTAITAAGYKFIKEATIVDSCSTNYYSVPIPNGYTPDWFGAWYVCEQDMSGNCGSFLFNSGDPSMSLASTTWEPQTTYYLYVYAVKSKQLLTSYVIGTPVAKRRKAILTFSSPFANGFQYPAQDFIGFEIVHASP